MILRKTPSIRAGRGCRRNRGVALTLALALSFLASAPAAAQDDAAALKRRADAVLELENVAARDRIDAVFDYAAWLLAKGRDAEAIRYLKAGLRIHAWRLDQQLALAGALVKQGDRKGAEGAARLILERTEDDALLLAAAEILGKPMTVPRVPPLTEAPAATPALVLLPLEGCELLILQELQRGLAERLGIEVHLRHLMLELPPFARDFERDFIVGLPPWILENAERSPLAAEPAPPASRVELLIGIGQLQGHDAQVLQVPGAGAGALEPYTFSEAAAEAQRQQSIEAGRRDPGGYRDGTRYELEAPDGRRLPIVWVPYRAREAKDQILAKRHVEVTTAQAQEALDAARTGLSYDPNHIIGAWLYRDPEFFGPGKSGFTSALIEKATPGRDMLGRRTVNFTVARDRQAEFADYTRRYVDKPMAIVVDDEIVSAPIIEQQLSENVSIHGGGSEGLSEEDQTWLLSRLDPARARKEGTPAGDRHPRDRAALARLLADDRRVLELIETLRRDHPDHPFTQAIVEGQGAARRAAGQHDAADLRGRLKKALEPYSRKGVAYLALARHDLFANDYNYVFGQAEPGVGVLSYARFRAAFNDETPDRKRLQDRLLKQGLASAGHVFDVERCTDPTCPRAFPISLDEHDAKSLDLCEECRAGFDRAFGRAR